jgi:hypothetical protein
MDVSVIAFLVLLGGSPAEHVIQMPSMDDCMRASEFVAQAQCLDQEEYDQHVETATAATASGALIAPPPPAPSPMQAFPSATQRRVRNALNPVPTTPTMPVRRLTARKAAPS